VQGDLDDLNRKFDTPGHRAMPPGVRPGTDGHCSVIIRAIGNPAAPTELYAAHTTWGPFETMTRVFKLYDLPWATAGAGAGAGQTVPATALSFSSYPGALYSNDDWYVTSAGLVVTETTIANNNASLWALVTPQTVLEWSRNMVANRLAANGPAWAAAFLTANSGTYK
jgi:hypothetical protein